MISMEEEIERYRYQVYGAHHKRGLEELFKHTVNTFQEPLWRDMVRNADQVNEIDKIKELLWEINSWTNECLYACDFAILGNIAVPKIDEITPKEMIPKMEEAIQIYLNAFYSKKEKAEIEKYLKDLWDERIKDSGREY